MYFGSCLNWSSYCSFWTKSIIFTIVGSEVEKNGFKLSIHYLMKFIYTVVIYCMTSASFIAAQSSIGELKARATQTDDQKDLIDIYIELSSEYLKQNVDTSLLYAEEAMHLADSLAYRLAFLQSKLNIGKGLLMKGNSDSTSTHLHDILESDYEVSDSSLIAEIYYLQGNIEEKRNNKDMASAKYFRALGMAERNNNPQIQADVYNSLGTLTMGAGDMPKAIEYLTFALSIGEASDLPMVVIRQLINLSICYDDTDIKASYLDRAIPLAQEHNHTRALSFAYVSKAHLHEVKNEWPQAIEFLEKAYQIALQTGDLVKQKQVLLELGKAYVVIKSYDKAIEVLQKNLDADSIGILARNDIAVYELLSEIYVNKNQFQTAYDHLVNAYDLREINYRQNIEDNLEEANARYETERKDAEIARQILEIEKKDNTRNRIMGGSAFIVLFLGSSFLYSFERQKRKKKEAELMLVEKKKEAEKLKELDELKTQFFTNVSHEFRTPLTLILGPLSDVKDKIKNHAVQESIQLAHSNAGRLLNMVNEVLDLSKLESGQMNAQYSKVPIKSCLQRIIHTFDSLARMRNITINFDADLKNIVVQTDVNKVEKILNNLISNAIKYSHNDSVINIRATLNDERLEVSVTDQGKGIDPTEVDKIFNRFYQSNIVMAVEGGGTGIGLALSRELAELLDGNLTVESKLGQGSTFTLNIPISVLQVERPDDMIDKEPTTERFYQPILINGEKPHLLLVDDNADMLDYLQSILMEEYRCTFAKDGYEAMQKIQTNSFDLISADIMMPNMDGIQLKTKVNELLSKQQIPFIFLTAKSLEENILEGLSLGVDDYITKPFNKKEYKARIRNLLQNKIERGSFMSESSRDTIRDRNVDEVLLRKAEKSVKENLDNPNYKVKDLAKDLNYSQRQLTRIMKELTGMSPVNFIAELRLQRAYHLLKSNSRHSVSEVMYDVGIESASYFSRKFTERFGIRPSEM